MCVIVLKHVAMVSNFQKSRKSRKRMEMSPENPEIPECNPKIPEIPEMSSGELRKSHGKFRGFGFFQLQRCVHVELPALGCFRRQIRISGNSGKCPDGFLTRRNFPEFPRILRVFSGFPVFHMKDL
jgi:hypothetical protein